MPANMKRSCMNTERILCCQKGYRPEVVGGIKRVGTHLEKFHKNADCYSYANEYQNPSDKCHKMLFRILILFCI